MPERYTGYRLHKQSGYLQTKSASIKDILAGMPSSRGIGLEGRLRFVTRFLCATASHW